MHTSLTPPRQPNWLRFYGTSDNSRHVSNQLAPRGHEKRPLNQAKTQCSHSITDQTHDQDSMNDPKTTSASIVVTPQISRLAHLSSQQRVKAIHNRFSQIELSDTARDIADTVRPETLNQGFHHQGVTNPSLAVSSAQITDDILPIPNHNTGGGTVRRIKIRTTTNRVPFPIRMQQRGIRVPFKGE